MSTDAKGKKRAGDSGALAVVPGGKKIKSAEVSAGQSPPAG